MPPEDNNPQPQTSQGNSPEARSPDGTMLDQNPTLTQPSGTESKTNTDASPAPNSEGKSFLNREPKAADTKAPDAPAASEEKVDAKPEAPAGAPDKYSDFRLPEGYTFDADALKEVSALFKDSGLSQDQAQKMVDYYANNSLKAAQAPYDLWANTQKGWVAEIENRFGSKAETMARDINQAIDSAITSPKLRSAFREALDFTGAGSNPDFFEALSILAKPFLEGTSVAPGRVSAEANKPPTQPRVDIAAAMYPHLVGNRQQ